MKPITWKKILAISTLSGTTIGVGIFSLPYVAARVGFGLTMLYLAVLAVLVTLVHLSFSEVALKTPDFLRLPGYAGLHLGDWGRKAAIAVAILGSVGTLLVYIIIGGSFLGNLLLPFLGGSIFYILFYILFWACFLFFGELRRLQRLNFGV
ncbi:hypothetical protein KKC00_00965 [Patescibacteria group bacterium]|nr:hypothetical protein [Patescibacteria group bacterium]